MNQRIVVLGGYGVFGGAIAANLSRLPGVSLVIAGRSPQKGVPFASSLGAAFVCCDRHDLAALRQAITSAFLVIHAAGPFASQDHSVARICLDAGAHYLDIADGREHVGSIGQLHDLACERGLLVCSGASTTPGVTAAMVGALASDGMTIEAIHCVLSPGNRNPRGIATVAMMLGYAGESIAVTAAGQPTMRTGWLDGETLSLPAPVGRRNVYTVDTPDLALFPEHFRAATVTFKAGLELGVVNAGMTVLALLRRYRLLPNLAGRARLLTALSWALYAFGSPHGAVAVRVVGHQNNQRVTRRLAIIASRDGPMVAAAPATLLARGLVTGQITERGAFPCLGRVSFADLMAFLEPFGIRAVWGGAVGWRA